MPEFQPTPTRSDKTTSAEWLLARLTTPTRASAIFGDLVEVSATRGRLWFWFAYARTLIALGWRTLAAFLIAIASVSIMFRIYPMWVQHELRHLSTGWPVNMFFGQLAVASGPLLNSIAMCLWFALPFAWIRFGLRDRLTTFACVMFLSTLGVFSFRPWLIDGASILTTFAILAALLSSGWRKPLAVLALTFATAIAAVAGCFRLLAMTEHEAFLTFSPTREVGWLVTAFALAITAIVCSLLHRRLLRTKPADFTHSGATLA